MVDNLFHASAINYSQGRIWGYVSIHILYVLFMLVIFLSKIDFSNCVNVHYFKIRFVFHSSNKLYTNRQWSSLLNWKLREKKEKLKKCMKGMSSTLFSSGSSFPLMLPWRILEITESENSLGWSRHLEVVWSNLLLKAQPRIGLTRGSSQTEARILQWCRSPVHWASYWL